MDLAGTFPDQEQTTDNQNQIATRYRLAENGKKRFGQSNQPGQKKQQPNTHEHGHEQTNAPGDLLLRFGQLVHQNRNKNNVVNAQHQLQHGQGSKGNPDLRVVQ